MQDASTTQERSETEHDNDPESRQSKRARRHTYQPEGYVDSTEMLVSSSPLYDDLPDGSQASSESLGYVDRDTHHVAITPEDDTLRLASCVIRHILYFAPPQNSASNSVVVEFRDAKTRLDTKTSRHKRQIVAIDDGGLCLRRQMPDGGFALTKSHVAILEAKAQFQCLENGRPVISDGCLAQMVCEALAARLSKVNGDSEKR